MPASVAAPLRHAAATVRGFDPDIHVVVRAEFKDGDEELTDLLGALLHAVADGIDRRGETARLTPAEVHALTLARRILGESA